MKLPVLLSSALLAALAQGSPARTLTYSELRTCYDVSDQVGRIVLAVESRLIHRGDYDFEVEITMATPEGQSYRWAERVYPETLEHPERVTESLEVIGGRERVTLETTGGPTSRVLVLHGSAKLEFPDNTMPVESRIKSEELAAFRESIPAELRDLCELLGRAGDALREPNLEGSLIVPLAAPKGVKADPGRAARWTRENVRVTQSKREIPILDAPPDPATLPPGGKAEVSIVRRERTPPSGLKSLAGRRPLAGANQTAYPSNGFVRYSVGSAFASASPCRYARPAEPHGPSFRAGGHSARQRPAPSGGHNVVSRRGPGRAVSACGTRGRWPRLRTVSPRACG